MLFTTAVFVGVFLPITLLGFFASARASTRAAALWLFVASVFFYGYWIPEFTLLLLGSIAGNFMLGLRIAATRSRHWLAAGVLANLALLAYFKYANFFVDNLNALLGTHWQIGHVVLPIGISFFTFTQIAFLVDTYHAKVNEFRFVHYGLFVTYFPHLIAGPVLHHAQMMPQFAKPQTYRFDGANFTAGLGIFAIGLLKKVVLADGIAPYADAVFKPVDEGASPGLVEAWLGALAYTLQLYFDFSGYSDMAVGLSWMFNIRLPFNFDSPYRATSITAFWRRWHISLSNFLRDYLYIPLGGNRQGSARRYANLVATMVLGGLWHGANWTFVAWGGLHGLYLVLNHGWRALLSRSALLGRLEHRRIYLAASWASTMLAVVVAWVFFRAESFGGAGRMLAGMSGLVPAQNEHPLLWNAGLNAATGWQWCFALSAIALWPINSNRLGECLREGITTLRLRDATAGAALFAVLFLVLVNTTRDAVSAFIYFNF